MSTQNLIQIKRSEATAVPPSLANGELAWSSNGNILYIGDFGSVIPIAGELNPGVLTANQALVANSTGSLDEIRTAELNLSSFAVTSIVDDDTFAAGIANTSLATSESIKAYVDSTVGAVVSDFTITGDTGSDLFQTGETLDFTGNVGIATAITNNQVDIAVVANSGIIANTTGVFVDAQDGLEANTSGLFVTTGNGITIDGSGNVAISTGDNVTFGNLNVQGDLVVSGNVTSLDVTQLKVEDTLIHLGSNNTADTLDLGFIGHYSPDAGATILHAGIYRDASDEKFHFFKDLEDAALDTGTNIVDKAANTYVRADVVFGNLEGFDATLADVSANSLSLTTDLEVTHGGTGLSTVTTNAVLYGQGTAALAEATGTAHQVLQLNASGIPVFGGLDGGTF